jgi:hypothetical protein
MSQSGTVTAVIHIGDCADEAAVVAIFGNRERAASNVLSDVGWFVEDVNTIGLADLLDLDDHDSPTAPGYWLLQGRCWGEDINTVDGGYYDGGFKIARFDMLPTDSVEAVRLVYEAVGVDGSDLVVVEDLLRGLCIPGFIRQDGKTRLGNLLGLLTVLEDMEDARACG